MFEEAPDASGGTRSISGSARGACTIAIGVSSGTDSSAARAGTCSLNARMPNSRSSSRVCDPVLASIRADLPFPRDGFVALRLRFIGMPEAGA